MVNGDMAKKKKKKKEKHLLGPKEFLFNFLSLVIIIGIGIYFGARSLYYYSKQNITIQEEAQTLNGLIINQNQVVTGDGDGLHRDTDGYYFKGLVNNNYVLFANRIFRVVRVNSDNSVKLVSENYVASFMWGEEVEYQKSNVKNWLEKTELDASGIYYNSIPNITDFLVKTSYSEDILEESKVRSTKNNYQDYVSLLSVKDYIMANGKQSYLNTGKVFYLLGYSSENENLYVEEDGSIQTCDSLDGYGIRPVITVHGNTVVSGGDGTLANPFVISQDNKVNYVDSYVRMGNDTWKVFEDKNGVLRLYYYGYINSNNQEIIRNYSTTNSIFDLSDKKNIAYYLNNDYLESTGYADYILENDYYIGEISDDAGYSFQNVYTKNVHCKVGLLNIFDMVSSNELADFFHINTTSEVGSMEYTTLPSGLLQETDVREEKHIVPAISISSSSIKSGGGTKENPYILG